MCRRRRSNGGTLENSQEEVTQPQRGLVSPLRLELAKPFLDTESARWCARRRKRCLDRVERLRRRSANRARGYRNVSCPFPDHRATKAKRPVRLLRCSLAESRVRRGKTARNF